MASINEVVAQEALDNLKKLGDNLEETEKKMLSLIPLVKEFADAMNKTTGLKDTINSINNLNKATENLHSTNVKRLDIEREIKRESDKMASTIMKEADLWKKVGEAMGKVQVDMNELTARIVENNIKLKENQKAQKESSDAINKAQKDYKNGVISIKEYNDIYDKNFEKLQLAIETQQELKAQLSEQQITLKNVTKEQASAAGSMDEMSQKLGSLRDAYRGLSEEERNNADIGGVMKAGINQLDEALKALDTSIGNNQRNVGNYSIASQSLVTELRNMKNELLETKININYFTDEITKQKAVLADLAKSHGENSKEYKEAQERLVELEKNQQNYINTSKELSVAIKDLTNEQKLNNAEMKMMTDPSLAFNTLAESVNFAVQSYAAYKGILALVGTENKELEQTMKKLMGVMQLANTIQRITNTLIAQNGLATKVKVMWEKVSIAYQKELAIVQAKKTAATVADTAATGAATGATIGFAAAIRTVGKAFYSLPLIGQLLAIIAAVAALGTLIYKLVTAEKELTEEQAKRKQLMEDLNNIQSDVLKNTQENEQKLKQYTSQLGKVKQGSKEWNAIVREIASITGKDYEELKKFPDQIKKITNEWIEQYKKRAQLEATFKLTSDRYVKNETAILDLQTQSKKEREETVKQMEISADDQKTLLTLYERYDKVRGTGLASEKEYLGYIQVYESKSRRNLEAKNNQLIEQSSILDVLLDKQEKAINNENKGTKNKKDKSDNEEEKRIEYLMQLRIKQKEFEAKTDTDIMNAKIEKIIAQRDKEIEQHKITGAEKEEVERIYQAQIDKLREDFAKKQLEKLQQATNETLAITNKLNEDLIKNEKISNEEKTQKLVEAVKKRHGDEFKAFEEAKQKELEGLEVNGDLYLKIVEKWDKKVEEQKQKNAQEIVNIQKNGFDAQLKLLNQQAKDEENRRIIDGEGIILAKEQSQIKIDLINAEIEKLLEYKDTFAELGMTEEEYTSRMLELRASAAEETKRMLDEEMQKRFEVAQATTDAYFTIANAAAGLIEDEKERVIVQQKLAMAQLLLTQGLAIAQAILYSTPGDPYSMIARIATAVAAVVAGMITGIVSINKAKSAYAEGTDYHRGGSAIIGEGGQAELVETPSGKSFVVREPMFFDKLPVGSSVTPMPELNTTNFGNFGYDSDMIMELRENNQLLRQIAGKPVVTIDVNDKITSYIERKNSKAKILNAKFKV